MYRQWNNAYQPVSDKPHQVLNRQSFYPYRYDWYRENPFSSTNLVRSNVAGYYPQVTVDRNMEITPQAPFEYAWQYVCSTIFPKDPEYVKNRQIIPQP